MAFSIPAGVTVTGTPAHGTIKIAIGLGNLSLNLPRLVDAADHVNAPTGGVFLSGGSGNDGITGTQFADHLHAGTGADHINGGAGDDVIAAGPGADVLTGGAGNDTFAYQAGFAHVGVVQTITDFGGAGSYNSVDNDFIRFAGFGAGSTFKFVADSISTDATRHVAVYDLHDTATGHDYKFIINSTDGTHLAAGRGDFQFY